MRFKLEESYQITICKYLNSNIVRLDKGIYLIGRDEASAALRVPRFKNTKHFIPAIQLADYGQFIYIPEDQIPEDETFCTYSKPLAKATMTKLDWGRYKAENPYRGVRWHQ